MTFLKSFASNCGDAVEDACGTAMDGDPDIGWLGSSMHSGSIWYPSILGVPSMAWASGLSIKKGTRMQTEWVVVQDQ